MRRHANCMSNAFSRLLSGWEGRWLGLITIPAVFRHNAILLRSRAVYGCKLGGGGGLGVARCAIAAHNRP